MDQRVDPNLFSENKIFLNVFLGISLLDLLRGGSV